MSNMADEILSLVKARPYCSFAEINRTIQGFSGGDLAFISEGPKHSNIVIWVGMTQEGFAAIDSLLKSGSIKAEPAGLLTYIIDGIALTMPLAKKRCHYKKPHWAPTVLNTADYCSKKSQEKVKGIAS